MGYFQLGLYRMRVANLGAAIIGGTLLSIGLVVLMSNIDPLAFCFKQCDVPRAISTLLGAGSLRLIVGLFYTAIGLFFLAPLVPLPERQKQ